MATDSNTLLDEAKCLGCGSNSSTSDLLKLGILSRIASAYSAVQSFITRAGITDPVQMEAIQVLAESAVNHGWWTKCDLIYPFVGGTALAHSQNLKSSNFTITWNGTVTHNTNGVTGNGIDGYGNTGFNPATDSVRYTLNSASVAIYRRTFGVAFLANYCGVASGGNSVQLIRGTPFTTPLSVNSAGGTAVLSNTVGFVMASRAISTQIKFYVGSTQFNVASNSTAVPSDDLYIFALNNAGPASFGDANLAGLTLGSSFTLAEFQTMAADWQTFNTALGRNV